MIELRKVSKTYNAGTVTEMCLFDGFDLTVADGEFVSVVGSNGSGKTSLLNIICGSMPFDSGTLLLDGIQDPGNLGTILRTADALQIPAVLLDGCADPYNPKTVRASMGAVFRTQPVRMTRQQAIAACRDAGIPLLATAMSADAVDLRQAELPSAAVIIGSEGQGICQELFDAAQGKIIIPMSPRCESLNAAVAAAIVLWQMKR